MSSTKTIGIIGGGQLGQMMAISAIYMGHKGYHPLILQQIVHLLVCLRLSWPLTTMWMPFVSWRTAVMFSLMSLKMSTLTALTLLSKDVQLPQGTDLLRISQNRIFEKDFLSNKAKVTVAPYKVVTSSLDLEDIDFSKKYVLKTATGGYDGHGQKKSSHQPTIWKRQMPC